MSDSPDDDSGNDGQGGQPEGGQPQGGQGGQPQGGQGGQPQGGQGGQPQGGQGGQPQGGAPQGGQPQGGAPQGGQPQGGAPQGGQPRGGAPQGGQGPPPQGGAPQGQPAGGAPVNTGPSVGDIFSRNDTLDEIKFGVALYALVGFGIGLAMFAIGNSFSSTSGGGSGAAAQFASQLGAAIAVGGSVGIPIAVSAVLALLIGNRVKEELTEVPDNLVLATAAVTTAGGSIVTFFLSILLLGLGTGSVSFNGLILPLVLTGVGAAIIAAGRIWIEDNLIGQSAPPQQPPNQQQY